MNIIQGARSLAIGLAAVTAAIVLGPVLGRAPAAHGQGEVVKIVSSLPRTGPRRAETDSMVQSIRLRLEQSSYRAGPVTVEYEDLDDAAPVRGDWDAGRERENALQAANDPDVVAYIGPYNSGAARVSMPILNQAGLVMVSPANTYPGLTRASSFGDANEPAVYAPSGRPNYARVVPPDDEQGIAAAVWARAVGVSNAYVLHDGERYGAWLAAAFSQEAQAQGLQVTGPEPIDAQSANYPALATKVRAFAPDLVYVSGVMKNNLGPLVQSLRAVLGPDVRIMGPEGLYDPQFIAQAGTAANGVMVTVGSIPPGMLAGKGADWYSAYRARYQAEPGHYADAAYEAVSVVMDALARVGRNDREAIRAAVLATSDYDGILGRWSFDGNGDTTLGRMSGRTIVNGQLDDAGAIVIEYPVRSRAGDSAP